MNGFWIVFRRELAARRLLLVVSAAMGLFLALLPWIQLSPVSRPAELRGVSAVGAALLWGLTLAAGLGATAVGTALASRRLAFDYRLPASELAIWLGRLVAGLLLLLGGCVLVILVPLPFGLDLEGGSGALDLFVESALAGTQALEGLLALAPLVLAALFLLAHATSVALAGSRSWIAADLTAILVAKGGVWLAWRELGLWTAGEARMRLLAGALTLTVAGLLAASAAAARQGRSEPDRAHRAMALGLLVAMPLVAAAALGYASWYLAPGPESLRPEARRERALGAAWSLTTGLARGRDGVPFAFLRHAASGRALRLGPLPGHPLGRPPVELSADGTTLVWPESNTPYSDAAHLWTFDARNFAAEPSRSALSWPSLPYSWALSPDGGEIVALRGGAGRVHLDRESLATGTLTAVVPLPVCRYADGRVRFVESGQVELLCSARDAADAAQPVHGFAVDLAQGEVVDLGPRRLQPSQADAQP